MILKGAIIFVGLTALLAPLSGTCYSQSVQEIEDRYARSLDWERSVSLAADTQIDVHQPIDTREITGQKDHLVFRRDGDSLAFAVKTKNEAVSQESHAVISNGKMISYVITNGSPIREVVMMEATKDVRMGMLIPYLGPLDGYFGGDKEKTIPEILKGASNIQVRPGLELIGGLHCAVIDAATPEGQFTLWVSPEQNYAMEKLVVEQVATSLFHGRPLSEQRFSAKDGDQIVKTSLTLDHIENSKFGDFYVPCKGISAGTMQLKDGRTETITETYDRTSVQLNPDFSKLRAFMLEVSNGTRVIDFDHQNNGTQYEWQDGKVVVSASEERGPGL